MILGVNRVKSIMHVEDFKVVDQRSSMIDDRIQSQ